MIPKGLFTQIAMVILAVAIIVTYVKPAFTEIGAVQDNIEVYQAERDKVISVNAKLADLQSRLMSISNEDKRKLLTYMPDSVDVIAVPRDLTIISNEAGVLYKNSTFLGSDEKVKDQSDDAAAGEVSPAKYDFSLAVEGTYSQIKKLFVLMEQNNYPLEVQSVTIKEIDGGFLSADLKISTYAYYEPVINNKINF